MLLPAAKRHPRRAASEDMWCSELILRMVVPHIEWDYLQTGTMPLTLLLLGDDFFPQPKMGDE